MPSWSSDQYLKFGEERTRPCRDLAARISVPAVRQIIDLGCGPGNSTEVLAELWPDAGITGLDNSADMIVAARQARLGCKWITSGIEDWAANTAERFDIVFSNAALQWVPDHNVIYQRLLERVASGGAFAMQVPGNFEGPAHRLMREIAASPSWERAFRANEVKEWHVHDLPFYYDVLAPHSTRIDLWETEYIHVMPDAAAIVEWYRGTGLRPFLEALGTEEDRVRFTEEYCEGIRSIYPQRSDGRVLFPFRRLFAIAYR